MPYQKPIRSAFAKPSSNNIFKEMSFVFYYGLLVFKGLSRFEEITESGRNFTDN